MSEISAELIKELRAKTGAGVVDCKKALTESQGDIEAAVDILRKSGAAKADKKSGRITAEGRVVIKSLENISVMAEVNCETDFVAKNADFQNFVQATADQILKEKPKDVDALLGSSFQGKSFKEAQQEIITKTGENISVRRFVLLSSEAGEKIGSYLHMGDKIGVLVKMKGPADKLSDQVSRDVAMHVAASAPSYLAKENIPADVIAKEKEIYLEQMKDSNKPAQVLEKIIEGKISRFAEDICLLHQLFVKDPTGKQTVAQFLKEIHPDLTVVDFVRYQVGEGIAKRSDDFAAEVAKQLNG